MGSQRECYETIKECRVCQGTLTQVLRLNPQYIGTTFVKSNRNNFMSKVKIPLTLVSCDSCHLVQLLETVNPDLLYKNYFYRTSVNDTMKRDLSELVERTKEKVLLRPDDFIIDIGANDCTMISMFPKHTRRVAIEPAQNIDWSHVDPSIKIVNDYFSYKAAMEGTSGRKAKVITATAMFYDLNNPNEIVRDIKAALADDGVCVIQVSHLLATVKDMNFVDLVHEHVMYYSLETLDNLMERNGLSIFDASLNFVNGGSLRVFITHSENEREREDGYYNILAEEEEYGLTDNDIYKEFENNINEVSKLVKRYITDEISRGGYVIGLGASTKGNVLLQVCGVGKDILPYISDRSSIKVGLYTMGTDIKLINEEEARQLNPTVMFVLPFNFKEEIVQREKEYIDNGGKLLFALPYPYILDKNGEHKI